MLSLAAAQSLQGVLLLYRTDLITGAVPVPQQVGADSRFNVAMWKQGGFCATFSASFFFFLDQGRRISPNPREDPLLMSWNVTVGRERGHTLLVQIVSSLESHEAHVHPP